MALFRLFDESKGRDRELKMDMQEDDSKSVVLSPSNDSPDFEFGSVSDDGGVRSPLTMAMLFYVVTAGAIVSACLRSLVGRVELTSAPFLAVLVGGSTIGFFSGLIFGFFFFRSIKAASVSSCVAIVVGGVAGALAMVGGDSFFETSLIAFAGCWLMVVVMLVSARRAITR